MDEHKTLNQNKVCLYQQCCIKTIFKSSNLINQYYIIAAYVYITVTIHLLI